MFNPGSSGTLNLHVHDIPLDIDEDAEGGPELREDAVLDDLATQLLVGSCLGLDQVPAHCLLHCLHRLASLPPSLAALLDH